MPPSASIRVLVLGASTEDVCGVRDCAAVLAPALRRSGFRVETVWWVRDGRAGVRQSLADARRHAAEIARRVAEADVVLWHYSPFAYGVRGVPILVPAVLRSLRRNRVPVVGFLHELAYPWGRRGWRGALLAASQRLALRRLLRGLAGAVVTTEERRRELERRRGAPPVLFTPVPSNLPFSAAGGNGGLRFGLFGFRSEGTSRALVVGALERVRAAGLDARLVLVGAPGPDSPEGEAWRRDAHAGGWEEALSFTGVLRPAEAARELADLDAVVFANGDGPTARKGTLAAALGAGTAVVAVDGPRRWEDPVAAGALLLAPPDEEGLAAALGRVAADPTLRDELGTRGARFYAETMAPDAVAARLAPMLERVAPTRDPRPHVALVAHDIHDHGGMERVFAELIRRAHGRVRFTVVSATLAPDLRPLVDWRRVPVIHRPFPLKFVLFALFAAGRLFRLRADVVHSLGAIVAKRSDLATVQFCHAGYVELLGRLSPEGASPLRRVNHVVTRLLSLAGEWWCYGLGHARVLACVSHGVGSEVERHYPGRVILVTPNGVDCERFRPDRARRRATRRALGVGGEEIVALFVGGDWDRKGLGLALAGLARARAATSLPLRLWVVGRGNETRFRALARAHRVEDAVTFLGPRADTERFFSAADVFVLPTEYETFSLVSYEAAASRLPVVATAVSGIDELVGEDDAGILVARDARSVGDALARLAGDPELRRRLGREGRRRALGFDWNRSTSSVLTAYDSLLSSARPAGGATC